MNNNWYYWDYGWQFVSQSLIPVLQNLEKTFLKHYKSKDFQDELKFFQKYFVWRPTTITHLSNISKKLKWAQIFIKREDMTCVWAHKINHTIVQWLLAKRMGKSELIAETWAWMHGTSTAMVWAKLWLKVKVFMWTEDIKRQAPNVHRMKLLWAEVIAVDSGSKTLKDAVNEAMKYWINNVDNSYYLLWSALGPHPYPMIVAESQKIVWDECLVQFPELLKSLWYKKNKPDMVVACVWWWSNSLWIFSAYLDDKDVKLVWAEAWWTDTQKVWKHATRFKWKWWKVWIAQWYKTYFLQDDYGNIAPTHSISAGLDYAWIWPKHVFLHEQWRVDYEPVSDTEVIEAFHLTAENEGILPALESSHALAYVYKHAAKLPKDYIILVNLSGRGDKDLHTVMEWDKCTN